MKSVLLIIFMCLGLTAAAQSVAVNPSAFQYDMSCYVDIDVPTAMVDEDCTLVAMVNGECRGVGVKQSKNGYTWYYVRVYSNLVEGENVYFGLIDGKGESVKALGVVASAVVAVLPFENLKAVGLPSSPCRLNSFASHDVNGDGVVDKLDVDALADIVVGKSTDCLGNADVNADAIVNISDVTTLVGIVSE